MGYIYIYIFIYIPWDIPWDISLIPIGALMVSLDVHCHSLMKEGALSIWSPHKKNIFRKLCLSIFSFCFKITLIAPRSVSSVSEPLTTPWAGADGDSPYLAGFGAMTIHWLKDNATPTWLQEHLREIKSRYRLHGVRDTVSWESVSHEWRVLDPGRWE